MKGNYRWPLVSNIIRHGDVSNTFGMVRRNADGTKRAHQGWDFYAPIGEPCHAIAPGKVVYIGKAGAYGNLVVQSFAMDDDTVFAAFAHLSAVSVSVGQVLVKGAKIGLTGDSGNAKGMTGKDLHLHFEIRTEPTPGLGLTGRISPLEVFRQVPLDQAILDPVK